MLKTSRITLGLITLYTRPTTYTLTLTILTKAMRPAIKIAADFGTVRSCKVRVTGTLA